MKNEKNEEEKIDGEMDKIKEQKKETWKKTIKMSIITEKNIKNFRVSAPTEIYF